MSATELKVFKTVFLFLGDIRFKYHKQPHPNRKGTTNHAGKVVVTGNCIFIS